MRLYKIAYHLSDTGSNISWATSKAKARKIVTALKREFKGEYDDDGNPTEGDYIEPQSITINPKEIPTTKKELTKWLNDNWPRENG